MSCKEQTAKKYKTRNSPSYSAQDCKGQTLKGKDGMYKSKPDKNKVYKWVKVSSNVGTLKIKAGKHKYTTEDNGSKPFVIYDYGKHVDIYNNKYDQDKREYFIEKKILTLDYRKIFPGDNGMKLEHYIGGKGNSVLLEHTHGSYTYIGESIRNFKTIDGDVIRKYYSPIGNNDVPYPYAIGDKYTYLMIEDVYIPNTELDMKGDPYEQYYGAQIPDNKTVVAELNPREKAKRLRFKTIVKRFAYT
jgi:hypothetical protein